MQKQIITSQVMRRAYLAEHFKEKRIGVLTQDTIQTRALVKFFKDVQSYAAAHTPENYYNGVAEQVILAPLVNIIAQRYYLNPGAYQTGSISHDLLSLGNHLAESTQILNQIMTKMGVSRVVDLQAATAMSQPNFQLNDLRTISEQFIFGVLVDPANRAALIGRLNNLTIPYMAAPTQESIMNLYSIVGRGKGQIIPTDHIPYMITLRGIVLTMIEDLMNAANANNRQEWYADVISSLTLYLTYINITEADTVYDTAFPEIHSAGANHTIHQKTVSTFKQMALLYSKTGLVYRSWAIDITEKMINEVVEFIPGAFDYLKSTQNVMDATGALTLDYSPQDHASIFEAKWSTLRDIVKKTLPDILKPYMAEVIDSFKKQAGVDILLPTMIYGLSGTDIHGDLAPTGPQPPFVIDLWPLINGLGVEVTNVDLEGTTQANPLAISYITRREINEFIVSRLYPAIEGLFGAAVSLNRAYKVVTSAVGAPFGTAIPGVTQELTMDRENVIEGVTIPDAESPEDIMFSQLDKVYDWRFVLSPLRVENDDNRMTQNWSLLPYLHRNLRLKNLFMSYAQTGRFPALPDIPSQHPYFEDATHKWSWPNNHRNYPTFMSEANFAWTPIPFNYTGDTAYGRTTHNGDRIQRFMTNIKKYPNADWMSWSDYLFQYIRGGISSVTNIAMSLAGLGFLYRRNATGNNYSMIDPELPFIYGVPSIFMMDANRLDLSRFVNNEGRIENGPSTGFNDPEFSRLIYETRLSVSQLGDWVFVLHQHIPKERPLSYFPMWLRHGFVVEMPIITELYNVYQAALREAFNGFAAATTNQQAPPSNQGQGGNTQFAQSLINFSSPVTIREAYGFVNTIMQLEPNGKKAVGKAQNAVEYWKSRFSAIMNKNYSDFFAEYFRSVIGWSKVITPYPHVWMRYRYAMSTQVEPATVLSPYSSTVYVEKEFEENIGSMAIGRALSIYDPDIIRLDYEDVQRVENSQIYKLDIIGDLAKPERKWKGTAVNAGGSEAEQIADNKIKSTGGEGVHVVPGSENSQGVPDVTTGEVASTLYEIATKVQTDEPVSNSRNFPSDRGNKVASTVQQTSLDKIDPATGKKDGDRKNPLTDKDNTEMNVETGQRTDINEDAISTKITDETMLDKEKHVGTGDSSEKDGEEGKSKEKDKKKDDKDKKDKSSK